MVPLGQVLFRGAIAACVGCFEQAGVVADDVQDQEQCQDPVYGLGGTGKPRDPHGQQCHDYRQIEQLEEPKQPPPLIPIRQVEDEVVDADYQEVKDKKSK